MFEMGRTRLLEISCQNAVNLPEVPIGVSSPTFSSCDIQEFCTMQLFAKCGEVGIVTLTVPAYGKVADIRAALLRKRPNLAVCDDLCFMFGGRRCIEDAGLTALGIQRNSTVEVQRRLRGGGGDGGATGAESRSSYLEMYMEKKPDKVDPNEERIAKWTRCLLSGEPLSPPCVADELGHLFNKDAVVSALVAKSMPRSLSHISSLKHVIDLKLERNPNYKGDTAANDKSVKESESRFYCPITGADFNGRFRFVVLRPSGHVISERALKQVPAAVEEHLGAKWSADDIIPINGTEEEVDTLREKMLNKRAAEKAAKKAKKHSKAPNGVVAVDVVASAATPHAMTSQASALLASARAHASPAAQKLPKREAEVQLEADTAASRKKFKAADHAPEGADKKVYASIFTSSSGPTRETYGARSVGARFI